MTLLAVHRVTRSRCSALRALLKRFFPPLNERIGTTATVVSVLPTVPAYGSRGCVALAGPGLTGVVAKPVDDESTSVLIGNLGSSWRAEVDRAGRIHPFGEQRSVGFQVAADDRWHDPALEPSVRSQRLEAMPVVETRVRIPSGDLVQRAWTTIAAGGVTVVEFYNDSPLPVAVAVDHPGILTGPAPTTSLPADVNMPSDSVVLPVGHHATVRIGVPHTQHGSSRLPADLPSADEVIAGWRAVTDRAGRFELPAGTIGGGAADATVASRCDWLLGDRSEIDSDPVAVLIEIDQLVRMGEPLGDLMPIVADAVESAARHRVAGLGAGLEAAGRVLAAAGERRALTDLDRVAARVDGDDSLPAGRAGQVIELERRLLRSRGDQVEILPGGMPEDWSLQGLEVFGLAAGLKSSLSFALRWHGRHPAIIWERTGAAISLSSPLMDSRWASDSDRGEQLWEYEAAEPSVP